MKLLTFLSGINDRDALKFQIFERNAHGRRHGGRVLTLDLNTIHLPTLEQDQIDLCDLCFAKASHMRPRGVATSNNLSDFSDQCYKNRIYNISQNSQKRDSFCVNVVQNILFLRGQ